MILAFVGLVLGFLPPTAWLAWLALVPAAILSVVTLAKKGSPKGRATAALLIATMGWAVALFVTAVATVGGIN